MCFATSSLAQDKPQSAPLLGPKPVFVPGMYESESRNSHFQDQPIKSKVCLASADYDHFLADTMAQYRASPQFDKTCALSQTEPLANGFALAMACPGVKTVITYRFSKVSGLPAPRDWRLDFPIGALGRELFRRLLGAPGPRHEFVDA